MVKNAITIAREGGIIIYPTDTAYGIGCRIDNHESVDRVFKIRRRPLEQAMPVLVSSIEMALTYFDSQSDIVRRLMKQYWPGALTIVASCKKELIYSPIRGGGETVGLRMPNNRTILKIIEDVGVPILGPSANFHGDTTPYSFADLNSELIKLVDYVVPACPLTPERSDGGRGECTVKQASTVVDCSEDPYKILRQGAVKL
jgi:L-threonylcarbamoyladenylate synthase